VLWYPQETLPALRLALITHYKHATDCREVWWLKTRREVWWLKTRRQCRYQSRKRARQRYASDAGHRSEEDSADKNDAELDGLGSEHAEEEEEPDPIQEEWGAHARNAGDNDSNGSVHSARSADEMEM